jgi:hypothetical protein
MSLPIQTLFDLPLAVSVKVTDTVLLGQDGQTVAVQVGTLCDGVSISSFSGAITASQHGNLSGGLLHAIASQSTAGFMGAGDKVALDGLVLSGSGSITGLFGTITDLQHGARFGGTLHLLATGSYAGFLSPQDKQKLNAFNGSFTSIFGTLTATQHGTHSAPWLHAVSTGSTSGFMSAADKVRLDSFSGSFTNIFGTITDSQHGVRFGGTLHAEATGSYAGFLSPQDKQKLNTFSAFNGSFSSIFGAITDAQHGSRGGGSLHVTATGSSAGFLSATDKQLIDAKLTPTQFQLGYAGTNNDSYRSEYWIAARTDGRPGSGAINDPFDVSDFNKFDGLFRSFAGKKYITWHIAPGLYESNGGIQGGNFARGYEFMEGWRFKGAGIDNTIIRLVGGTVPGTAYTLVASGYTTYNAHNTEVCDLTFDCNLRGQGINDNLASSAVSFFGSNCAVRRVKARQFGSRCTSEAFVIAINTHPYAAPKWDNGIIEDCIIEDPDDSSSGGGVTIMHCGGGDVPPSGQNSTHEGFVVRNNYINLKYFNGGGNPLFIQAVSLTHAGTIATMTFDRLHRRVPGQRASVWSWLSDATHSEVYHGFVTITGTTPKTLTYVIRDLVSSLTAVGTVATVVSRFPHRWNVNDKTEITGINEAIYNGIFTITSVSSGTVFTYNLPSLPVSSVAVVNPFRASSGNLTEAEGMRYTHSPAADFASGVVPPRLYNNIANAISVDGGRMALVYGNRVLNSNVGGPYHDTFNSREVWCHNNWFKNVTGALSQNLVNVASFAKDETKYNIDSLTFVGTVVTAFTGSPYNSLHAGETVIVSGATGASASLYNGTFAVTSSPPVPDGGVNFFTYNTTSTPIANGNTGFWAASNSSIPFTLTSLQRDLTFNAFGSVAVATCAIEHGLAYDDTVIMTGTGPANYFGAFQLLTPRTLTVVSSTATSPITLTVTAHGFANGDLVWVQGHTGNYNANGVWRIANVTANTFDLLGTVGTTYFGINGSVSNLSDTFPAEYKFRYLMASNPGVSAVTSPAYQTKTSWYTIKSLTASGTTATAVTSRPHGYVAGQTIPINSARGGDWRALNGRRTVSLIVDPFTLQYEMPYVVQYGTLSLGGRYARIWEVERLYFHNNIVELAPIRDLGYNFTAINIYSSYASANQHFGYVSIKNNELRYFTGDDGARAEVWGDLPERASQSGYGIWLGGVKNAVVQNNVIDINGAALSGPDTYGIFGYLNGTVSIRNNHTSWGEPVKYYDNSVQAFNEDSEAKHLFMPERVIVPSYGTCNLFDAVVPPRSQVTRVSAQIDFSIEATTATNVAVLTGRATFNALGYSPNVVAGITYNTTNDCLTATSGTVSALWLTSVDTVTGVVNVKVVPKSNLVNPMYKVAASVIKTGPWTIKNYQNMAEWPPTQYPTPLDHVRLGQSGAL